MSGGPLRQIMLDAPSAYWPMDEASGTTAFDRSGNGLNGTISGGVTLGVAGPAGMKAMDFNGTSGQVAIGDNNLFTTNDLTLVAWVRRDVLAHNEAIFTKSDSIGEWAFTAWGVSYTSAVLYNSAGSAWKEAHVDTGGTPVDKWDHWACSYDSAAGAITIRKNITEAVNTVTAGSGSRSGNLGDQVFIGRRAYSPDPLYFDGKICQVAYFPTALSVARLTAQFQEALRAGVVIG